MKYIELTVKRIVKDSKKSNKQYKEIKHCERKLCSSRQFEKLIGKKFYGIYKVVECKKNKEDLTLKICIYRETKVKGEFIEGEDFTCFEYLIILFDILNTISMSIMENMWFRFPLDLTFLIFQKYLEKYERGNMNEKIFQDMKNSENYVEKFTNHLMGSIDLDSNYDINEFFYFALKILAFEIMQKIENFNKDSTEFLHEKIEENFLEFELEESESNGERFYDEVSKFLNNEDYNDADMEIKDFLSDFVNFVKGFEIEGKNLQVFWVEISELIDDGKINSEIISKLQDENFNLKSKNGTFEQENYSLKRKLEELENDLKKKTEELEKKEKKFKKEKSQLEKKIEKLQKQKIQYVPSNDSKNITNKAKTGSACVDFVPGGNDSSEDEESPGGNESETETETEEEDSDGTISSDLNSGQENPSGSVLSDSDEEINDGANQEGKSFKPNQGSLNKDDNKNVTNKKEIQNHPKKISKNQEISKDENIIEEFQDPHFKNEMNSKKKKLSSDFQNFKLKKTGEKADSEKILEEEWQKIEEDLKKNKFKRSKFIFSIANFANPWIQKKEKVKVYPRNDCYKYISSIADKSKMTLFKLSNLILETLRKDTEYLKMSKHGDNFKIVKIFLRNFLLYHIRNKSSKKSLFLDINENLKDLFKNFNIMYDSKSIEFNQLLVKEIFSDLKGNLDPKILKSNKKNCDEELVKFLSCTFLEKKSSDGERKKIFNETLKLMKPPEAVKFSCKIILNEVKKIKSIKNKSSLGKHLIFCEKSSKLGKKSAEKILKILVGKLANKDDKEFGEFGLRVEVIKYKAFGAIKSDEMRKLSEKLKKKGAFKKFLSLFGYGKMPKEIQEVIDYSITEVLNDISLLFCDEEHFAHDYLEKYPKEKNSKYLKKKIEEFFKNLNEKKLTNQDIEKFEISLSHPEELKNGISKMMNVIKLKKKKKIDDIIFEMFHIKATHNNNKNTLKEINELILDEILSTKINFNGLTEKIEEIELNEKFDIRTKKIEELKRKFEGLICLKKISTSKFGKALASRVIKLQESDVEKLMIFQKVREMNSQSVFDHLKKGKTVKRKIRNNQNFDDSKNMMGLGKFSEKFKNFAKHLKNYLVKISTKIPIKFFYVYSSSIEDIFDMKKFLNRAGLNTQQVEEFVKNIGLLSVYFSIEKLTILQNKAKESKEFRDLFKDPNSVNNLLTKFKNIPHFETSEKLNKAFVELNVHHQMKQFSEFFKNLNLVLKLPELMKVFVWIKERGSEQHIDELRYGKTQLFSAENLKKLKRVFSLLSRGLQKGNILNFCEELSKRIDSSESKRNYEDYFELIAENEENIIALSDSSFKSSEQIKADLTNLTEDVKFKIKLNQEIKKYFIEAEKKKVIGNKNIIEKIEERNLEQLKIKLSMIKFDKEEDAQDDDNNDNKHLNIKAKIFVKLYINLEEIKKHAQNMHDCGYILNIGKAFDEETKKKKLNNATKIGKENIVIKLGKLNLETIQEDLDSDEDTDTENSSVSSGESLEDRDDNMSNLDKIIEKHLKETVILKEAGEKIVEEVHRDIQETVEKSEFHWMTNLQGNQFKEITKLVLKKSELPKKKVKELKNILTYALDIPEIEIEEAINEAHKKLKGSKDHWNNIKILKNLNFKSKKKNKKETTPVIEKDKSGIYYYTYNNDPYHNLYKFMSKYSLGINQHKRFLICNMYTSKAEIKAFLERILYDGQKRMYICLELHLLSKINLIFFIDTLKRMVNEVNRKGEKKIKNDNLFIMYKRTPNSITTQELRNANIANFFKPSELDFKLDKTTDIKKAYLNFIPKNVTVVTSAFSGLGKTVMIETKAKKDNQEVITIFLAGSLTPKNLQDRLKYLKGVLNKYGNEKKICLNIILDMMEGYENSLAVIDQILYQIIFLKCFPVGNSYVFLKNVKHFYIEIGNTFKNLLMNGLSILKIYSSLFSSESSYQNCRVDIDKIERKNIRVDLLNSIGREKSFHVVTDYLQMIKSKTINKSGYSKQNIRDDQRLKILEEYFINRSKGQSLDNANYVQMINFVKVLHEEFRKFNNLFGLSPFALNDLGVNLQVRRDICETIITLANKYSWSTIANIRKAQIETKTTKENLDDEISKNIQQILENYSKKMNQISKWEDWDETENSTIFFGESCMKFIYKNPKGISNGMKNIIISSDPQLFMLKEAKKIQQALSKIKDYDNFKDDDFIQEICEALDLNRVDPVKKRIKNFCNGEGYVITKDNYLKILLILQRANVGIPIILQGETGCGKTYMVNFIASCLMEEEFRCFTLHGGVTEGELVKRLRAYIAVANHLKNKGSKKRLWVLMDEFNTSPLQALLTEIIKDRRCSFNSEIKEIPDNMIFVGCCNPYRLKGKAQTEGEMMEEDNDEEEVGLNVEEDEGKFSHKVFPIPDALIPYVWDFGQLTPEAEAAYISSKLERAGQSEKSKYFETYKTLISGVINETQVYIRKIENESSVSLRDVKRFIKILKFFKEKYYSRGYHNREEEAILKSLAVTTVMCYFLRINSKKKKRTLSQNIDKIYQKCKAKLGFKTASFNVEKYFNDETTRVATEAKLCCSVPPGISLNNPLRENLFVTLICLELNIPLMICGKPGTSKTISIGIVFDILNNKRNGSMIFKIFRNCTQYNLWGSLKTTAKSILNIYEKIRERIDENRNEDESENYALIFDEVGLADKAPTNPLKVLHPILDPSAEDDEEQIEKDLNILRNQQIGGNNQGMEEMGENNENDKKKEKKRYESSFVGISNWKLDVSKMNRILYVSRPDMDKDDLLETCESNLDSQIESSEMIQDYLNESEENKNIVEKVKKEITGFFKVLSNSYFDFRKFESKKSDHKNFHGSRDFYSMIKIIGNKLNREFFENYDHNESSLLSLILYSIDRNFFGGKIGQKKANLIFKEILEKNLKKENMRYNPELLREERKPYPLFKESLFKYNSRHLMIFTEGAYKERIISEQIRKLKENEEEGTKKIIYLTSTEKEEDINNIAAKLPEYINQGYTIMMKDMDNIYGCLYDLFNQKYRHANGRKYLYLYYGDRKEQCEVHPKFKSIVFMNESDKKNKAKLPPPFLNRFEKYMIKEEDLLEDGKKEESDYIESLFSDWKNNLGGKEGNILITTLIPMLSKEMKFSLACSQNRDRFVNTFETYAFENNEREKINQKKNNSLKFFDKNAEKKRANRGKNFEKELKIMKKFFSITSRSFVNFLLKIKKGKTTEAKEIMKTYLSQHKIDDFNTFLKRVNFTKNLVFTFSSKDEMVTLAQDYKSTFVLDASIFVGQSLSDRTDILKKYISRKEVKNLVISFRNKKFWYLIENLRPLVDNIKDMKQPESGRFVYQGKSVIFMAHFSTLDVDNSEEIMTSINFMTTDWGIYTLDELSGESSSDYFEILGMKFGDFLQKTDIMNKFIKGALGEVLKEKCIGFLQNEESKKKFKRVLENINFSDGFLLEVIREKIYSYAKNVLQKKTKKAKLKESMNCLIIDNGMFNDLTCDFKNGIVGFLMKFFREILDKAADCLITSGLMTNTELCEIKGENIQENLREKYEKFFREIYENEEIISFKSDLFSDGFYMIRKELEEVKESVRKNYELSRASKFMKDEGDFKTISDGIYQILTQKQDEETFFEDGSVEIVKKECLRVFLDTSVSDIKLISTAMNYVNKELEEYKEMNDEEEELLEISLFISYLYKEKLNLGIALTITSQEINLNKIKPDKMAERFENNFDSLKGACNLQKKISKLSEGKGNIEEICKDDSYQTYRKILEIVSSVSDISVYLTKNYNLRVSESEADSPEFLKDLKKKDKKFENQYEKITGLLNDEESLKTIIKTWNKLDHKFGLKDCKLKPFSDLLKKNPENISLNDLIINQKINLKKKNFGQICLEIYKVMQEVALQDLNDIDEENIEDLSLPSIQAEFSPKIFEVNEKLISYISEKIIEGRKLVKKFKPEEIEEWKTENLARYRSFLHDEKMVFEAINFEFKQDNSDCENTIEKLLKILNLNEEEFEDLDKEVVSMFISQKNVTKFEINKKIIMSSVDSLIDRKIFEKKNISTEEKLISDKDFFLSLICSDSGESELLETIQVKHLNDLKKVFSIKKKMIKVESLKSSLALKEYRPRDKKMKKDFEEKVKKLKKKDRKERTNQQEKCHIEIIQLIYEKMETPEEFGKNREEILVNYFNKLNKCIGEKLVSLDDDTSTLKDLLWMESVIREK